MPDDGFPPPEPIAKRTLAEDVADHLRARILSGRLAADTPLRQEALARELGVSRIPLREALRQLEAEGLVHLAAHRGASVAPLSAAEAEELFDLRRQLELGLLECALPRLREGDFASLDAILDESRSDTALAHWGEINWRLHETLYRPAERPITLAFLRRIHDRIDRYLRLEIAVSKAGRERGLREHTELVALARADERDAALALLDRHIAATSANLLAALAAKRE